MTESNSLQGIGLPAIKNRLMEKGYPGQAIDELILEMEDEKKIKV